MDKLEKKWTRIAKKQLLGKTIIKVQYMTDEDMNALGWFKKGIVLVFDDGSAIYPSMDDEGNDAGSLHTTDDDDPVLPTL